MPWFFVKDVEEGGVFNYRIKNHLVEVRDSEHLQALRRRCEGDDK